MRRNPILFALWLVCGLTAHAQSTVELPGTNPEFREGAPLFTAQETLAPSEVLYDSYWTENGWNIHCSQKEFCSIHMKFVGPETYGNSKRYEPLVWADGEEPDMSIAFGIKSNTTRTDFETVGFEYDGRAFTGSTAEMEAGNYPAATIRYFLDEQLAATEDLGAKMPLKQAIWSDWEPEKKPIVDALVGRLYNNDPKVMKVIVYIDEKPVIGSVFDVAGFKGAWDAMQKERLARNKLAKEGKQEFRGWPDGT